jgi:hypothetical protein
MTDLVDLKPIKQKALHWPDPARTLILSEPDLLQVDVFLVKLGIWEQLLCTRGA